METERMRNKKGKKSREDKKTELRGRKCNKRNERNIVEDIDKFERKGHKSS